MAGFFKKLFSSGNGSAPKQHDGIDEMKTIQKEANSLGTEGEVYAAIGLALHLYLQDIHDYEKMVLTMQKVMRPYSPWSSKIYGLRQYPRR
ncbi:MAG: hypothetical protein HF314_06430 [Ignavibacteria bacterium]|jgi:hypothetical protein|nr:hypothetical protein [Ignavibacteria bacterium]MCU7502691.1 hypothetical protein [Ignavibacteria bacterium]MCU7517380.1 hypothetical protein [Ignavibacteria bacterium]